MYKIYINQTELLLVSSDTISLIPVNGEYSLHKYSGNKIEISNLLDYWEYQKVQTKIILFSDDLKRLIKDFDAHFKIVPAGGGFVLDPDNNVVLIHRRGFWDLPKGKLDPGESIEQCAIREVEEEVGLSNLTIVSKLCDTRHMYKKRSGDRAIKLSHWYVMQTENQALIPQTEEDILQAIWCPVKGLNKYRGASFPSIQDVIDIYCSKEKIEL